MHFSIIVAVDEKMGIGIKNDLPWHLSADLKHFATITKDAPTGKQNAVIMGRRTWESLPEKYRPLKGRVNVVLSRKEYTASDSGLVAHSLEDALQKLSDLFSIHKIFVIGGAQLFSEAVQYGAFAELYITRVLHTFPCDVFFPAIPASFKKVEESLVHKEQEIQFRFERWERV